MSALNLPGRKKDTPPPVPALLSRLETRREELRTRFAELQWDLGGAAYEMAARDYFRLDVLASMAAKLQVVDAELAEIERMARLERAGAAGSCAGCGSLYARGAIYCWRCGRNLNEGRGTVVGPAITAPVVPEGATGQPDPVIDPVANRPTSRPGPSPEPSGGPGPVIDQRPSAPTSTDDDPDLDLDTDPEPDTDPDMEPVASVPPDPASEFPHIESRAGFRPTPRGYQV